MRCLARRGGQDEEANGSCSRGGGRELRDGPVLGRTYGATADERYRTLPVVHGFTGDHHACDNDRRSRRPAFGGGLFRSAGEGVSGTRRAHGLSADRIRTCLCGLCVYGESNQNGSVSRSPSRRMRRPVIT